MANSFEIVVLGGPALEARPLSNAVGMSTEPLEPAGTLVVRLERQFRELGSTPGRVTLAPVARAGDALGDALAGSRTLGREDRTALHCTGDVIPGGSCSWQDLLRPFRRWWDGW
jgi:hypothetical protein